MEETREMLWRRQQIRDIDVDYRAWEKDKKYLTDFSRVYRGGIFVVDVFKCRYVFASDAFSDLFGYEREKLATIEVQGDYLESRIHPDDARELISLQVKLSRFIYRQPLASRNHYKNVFEYRVKKFDGEYVRVTSRQQVWRADARGKAWLILGIMDVAADQSPFEQIRGTVVNCRTGNVVSPFAYEDSRACELTSRELEILSLIHRGFLSKEIAGRLNISVSTVHVHRQNIFRKLNVRNALEAMYEARKLGLPL